MRPLITFPTSLSRALNYIEKKVQKGIAKLLYIHNLLNFIRSKFSNKEERFLS